MKYFFSILLIFINGICTAQNLVPNGDFEQYISCPTSYAQLDSCLFWSSPTYGSPDYFNTCAPSPVSIPSNLSGYQPSHSGEAYCGLVLYSGAVSNSREYIEVPLISTLIANQVYHFEMYVCIGDDLRFSSDDFGVFFSNTLITAIPSPLYYLSPQIINTVGFYPDTVNWSVVSGNFTANGGEQYLIIGNFKSDVNTSNIQVSNSQYTYSYLLVDDVSLTQVTGFNDLDESTSIKLYPIPFKDKLIIEYKEHKLLEIILYDITSRKIMNQKFTSSVSLNTKQLARGIYIYEVRNRGVLCKKGKIMKE